MFTLVVEHCSKTPYRKYPTDHDVDPYEGCPWWGQGSLTQQRDIRSSNPQLEQKPSSLSSRHCYLAQIFRQRTHLLYF